MDALLSSSSISTSWPRAAVVLRGAADRAVCLRLHSADRRARLCLSLCAGARHDGADRASDASVPCAAGCISSIGACRLRHRLSPLRPVAVGSYSKRRATRRIYRAGLEVSDAASGRRALHRPRHFDTLGSACCRRRSATCCPISFQHRRVGKLTSIASVVATPELSHSAELPIGHFMLANLLDSAIYLAMLWPVVRLISRLERRMAS